MTEIPVAEVGPRTAKRIQITTQFQSQFEKLGLEYAVYSKLLPQDGPDVSKRTWERRARDTG